MERRRCPDEMTQKSRYSIVLHGFHGFLHEFRYFFAAFSRRFADFGIVLFGHLLQVNLALSRADGMMK